jgi:hypothetical protein
MLEGVEAAGRSIRDHGHLIREGISAI